MSWAAKVNKAMCALWGAVWSKEMATINRFASCGGGRLSGGCIPLPNDKLEKLWQWCCSEELCYAIHKKALNWEGFKERFKNQRRRLPFCYSKGSRDTVGKFQHTSWEDWVPPHDHVWQTNGCFINKLHFTYLQQQSVPGSAIGPSMFRTGLLSPGLKCLETTD